MMRYTKKIQNTNSKRKPTEPKMNTFAGDKGQQREGWYRAIKFTYSAYTRNPIDKKSTTEKYVFICI